MIASDVFDYCEETGWLIFKKRPIEHFKNKKGMNIYNGRFAGKRAGHLSSSGYIQVRYKGKVSLAHRIVWEIYYGKEPGGMVDHIDGDPSNNRICNLRIVDRSSNAKNSKRSDSNTSGVTGVSKSFNGERWRSYITSKGKTISLGVYDEFEDAVNARKEAEMKYGFHENHGR